MKAVYFLIVALLWGGSYLAISVAIKGFSPFLAATLRVATAIIAVSIYIICKRVKFPKKRIAIETVLSGVIGTGIAWALLFWGEKVVEPALASVIGATSPIFTALFAAFIFKLKGDQMTWNKWIGVFVGFIGIAVIFEPFISTDATQNIWGLVAIVGTSACYGVGISWLKRVSQQITNVMAVLLACCGALIVLVPLTIIYGITDYTLTGEPLLKPILAILYLGLFSTTFAFICFFKLIKEVGSVQAAAVTYMIPIVAIVLDIVILGKWIGSHSLFGALIVFAALRLINKQAAPLPLPSKCKSP